MKTKKTTDLNSGIFFYNIDVSFKDDCFPSDQFNENTYEEIMTNILNSNVFYPDFNYYSKVILADFFKISGEGKKEECGGYLATVITAYFIDLIKDSGIDVDFKFGKPDKYPFISKDPAVAHFSVLLNESTEKDIPSGGVCLFRSFLFAKKYQIIPNEHEHSLSAKTKKKKIPITNLKNKSSEKEKEVRHTKTEGQKIKMIFKLQKINKKTFVN